MGLSSPSTPSVSVIVPAFNAMETLGGTIASALTQTRPAAEIIVVDDGSTDGTSELLAGHGERIRWVRQENAGVSAARNHGARIARGELLAFVDADDVLLPAYLERLVACWLDGNGRRAAASNAYFLRDEGVSVFRTLSSSNFPRGEAQRLAILQGNFLSAFMLFPADIYRELGGCDEGLSGAEDWDLWLRAIYSGVEAVYQPKPQALYRWRAGSMSSADSAMSTAEDTLLRSALAHLGPTMNAQERDYLRERLRQGSPRELRRLADEALLEERYDQARHLYGRASAMVPRDWKLRSRAASMRVFPPAGRLWRRRLEGSRRTL